MGQQMKITEKYEFLTDIITSYDGTEQRIKLRQHPRHYLTYDYSAMDAYEAQYLRAITRIRQTDAWYVPMWHNPAYLAENFVAGGDVLKIDPDYMYGFDEVEYICIHIKDEVTSDGGNIVRTVREYRRDEIEIFGKIDRRLDMDNTFVYPVRKCIVQPTLGLTYGYSNGTELAIPYEDLNVKSKAKLPSFIVDEYDIIENQYNRWNMPDTYGGHEVFFVEPQWKEDDDIQLKIEKNTQRMDNETGIFLYDLKNNHSYDIHSYVMLFETQQKINNMIKFFKRMGGRHKSFFMPTWANDFQITRDIKKGDNALYTDFKKMFKFYIGNSKQKYIIIFTYDWKSYIYPIMSYSEETLMIGEMPVVYGKLLLQTPIDFDLGVDSILMCSFFNLVRFDDDALTLEYESNIVARVTMSVREIDK